MSRFFFLDSAADSFLTAGDLKLVFSLPPVRIKITLFTGTLVTFVVAVDIVSLLSEIFLICFFFPFITVAFSI
jgi:hypothetical protein